MPTKVSQTPTCLASIVNTRSRATKIHELYECRLGITGCHTLRAFLANPINRMKRSEPPNVQNGYKTLSAIANYVMNGYGCTNEVNRCISCCYRETRSTRRKGMPTKVSQVPTCLATSSTRAAELQGSISFTQEWVKVHVVHFFCFCVFFFFFSVFCVFVLFLWFSFFLFFLCFLFVCFFSFFFVFFMYCFFYWRQCLSTQLSIRSVDTIQSFIANSADWAPISTWTNVDNWTKTQHREDAEQTTSCGSNVVRGERRIPMFNQSWLQFLLDIPWECPNFGLDSKRHVEISFQNIVSGWWQLSGCRRTAISSNAKSSSVGTA